MELMVTRKVRIELGGGGNGPTKPKREKQKDFNFKPKGSWLTERQMMSKGCVFTSKTQGI